MHAVPAPASHPSVTAPVPPGGRREVGAEDGVGLIEDEEGVVALAEGDELVEGGDVPIHGEDGVGDDDGRDGAGTGGGVGVGGVGQQLRQVAHVAVAVDRRGLSGRVGTRR